MAQAMGGFVGTLVTGIVASAVIAIFVRRRGRRLQQTGAFPVVTRLLHQSMGRFAAYSVAIIMAVAPTTAQAPPSLAPVEPLPPPFDLWIGAVRAEAAARGIRPEIIDQAFAASSLSNKSSNATDRRRSSRSTWRRISGDG